VLPLVPRQNANRRVSQVATVHAAFVLPVRARLLGLRFRGHFCVHFRYGPMTRSPSLQMALSINSRVSVSLRSAIQATRLLTITSVGLFPTEHTSLYWTCTGSTFLHKGHFSEWPFPHLRLINEPSSAVTVAHDSRHLKYSNHADPKCNIRYFYPSIFEHFCEFSARRIYVIKPKLKVRIGNTE